MSNGRSKIAEAVFEFKTSKETKRNEESTLSTIKLDFHLLLVFWFNGEKGGVERGERIERRGRERSDLRRCRSFTGSAGREEKTVDRGSHSHTGEAEAALW